MLFWILQSMFLSIIFILLIHHLIHFFKTTLTIPKMKDLVNAPTQKYDNIYNIIGKHQNSGLPSDLSSSSPISDTGIESFLPTESVASSSHIDSFLPTSSIQATTSSSSLMKNELKHFLKTQLKT